MQISDLKPNDRNPRKISNEKKEMLKKAITEFGDLGGVVFNRRTQQLVGGHQRVSVIPKNAVVEIEKEYEKPTRTGTIAEGYIEVSGERFRYREVDWDLMREEAANIAANQHGGEFDHGKLVAIVNDLMATGIDMDLVGFTAEELSAMMPEPEDDGGKGDEVPEPPIESQSKIGDVYELGVHRLMCGDSTSIDAVENLMKGERSNITFTSPPYNVSKQGFQEAKYNSGFESKTDEEYNQFLYDFTSIAIEKSDYVFVNNQSLANNRFSLIDYQFKFKEFIKDILIWNKSQCPPNICKGAFNTKFEFVFVFSKDNRTRGFPCSWQGKYPNVIETESNSGNEFAKIHKAGFPISFPLWIIEKMAFAKCVYDPFGGTGTTLIACEKTKRKCFMMELDPKYVDVIVTRYVKYTGNSKIKRNGEQIDWTDSE